MIIIILSAIMAVTSAQKIVEANTYLKIFNGTNNETQSVMKISGLLGYQTTEVYE